MQDEIKKRITVEADDAVRNINKVSDAEEELAKGTEKAGDAADKLSDKHGLLSHSIGFLKASILGLVASIVGGAGINAAYRMWEERMVAVNQHLEENLRLTRETAQASLDLQFLSMVPDPGERAFAEEQAAIAGRDATEGIRAYGILKSRNPNATSEELQTLLSLTALKAQQTTAPLGVLAGALDVAYKATGDPTMASNILEEAITQAGEFDVARFAPLAAKFVMTGQNVGGLTPGEAFGAVAGVTALGMPNEEAVTGLTSTLLSIRGRGTPEGGKILEREGVNRDDFFVALQQISALKQAGRITDAELELIGGREALKIFAAFSDERLLSSFMASVKAVDLAGQSESLIVSQKAEAQFGSDEVQRLNLQLKQQESALAAQRSHDEQALRVQIARNAIEERLEEAVITKSIAPKDKEAMLAAFDESIGYGESIEEAVKITQNTGWGSWVPLKRPVYDALEAGPTIGMEGEMIGPNGSMVVNNNQTIIHNQYNAAKDPSLVKPGRRELGE